MVIYNQEKEEKELELTEAQKTVIANCIEVFGLVKK